MHCASREVAVDRGRKIIGRTRTNSEVLASPLNYAPVFTEEKRYCLHEALQGMLII